MLNCWRTAIITAKYSGTLPPAPQHEKSRRHKSSGRMKKDVGVNLLNWSGFISRLDAQANLFLCQICWSLLRLRCLLGVRSLCWFVPSQNSPKLEGIWWFIGSIDWRSMQLIRPASSSSSLVEKLSNESPPCPPLFTPSHNNSILMTPNYSG